MRARVRYAQEAHRIRVTDGHEAEAKAAQSRRPPSRIGLFLLRALGLRGAVAESTGHKSNAGPAHTHPVHNEQESKP